jgi:hypothetical protein
MANITNIGLSATKVTKVGNNKMDYFPRSAVITAISLLGILILSDMVFAQPSPTIEHSFDNPTNFANGNSPDVYPTQTIELLPSTSVDVVIPDFRATILSDGSVTISGSGSAAVGKPTSGFDFEVDLKTGLYKTRSLDPDEIAALVPKTRPLRQSEVGRNSDNITSLAIVPGYWSGRVRLQTKDPVLIVLAETTTQLTWYTYSSGSVVWTSYSDACWAANPSSLGTHWYNSYCAYGGPWYSGSTNVCNDNSGNYYNWDFGVSSWRTDASHFVQLCGRNDAYFNYWWSHTDSGEGSWLIFGSILLN